MRKALPIFLFLTLSAPIFAAPPPGTMNDLVDIPTAEVLDYGSFETNYRFFTGGGLLSRINFGVFRRLNLGFSFTLDRFIGYQKIDAQQPELQVKFRVYDGGPLFPALAIGFDSQGYRFNDANDRYFDEDRGLYLAMSQEIILPGLFLHAGPAITDFKSDKITGFFGIHYDISGKAAIFTEYDHVRSVDTSRLNAGMRFFITPSFNLDFAVRDIGAGQTQDDGFQRNHERIIRLEYVGAF